MVRRADVDYSSALTALVQAKGPGSVPMVFLRNCSKFLVEPLSFLFFRSLEMGFVPPIWKRSYAFTNFKAW